MLQKNNMWLQRAKSADDDFSRMRSANPRPHTFPDIGPDHGRAMSSTRFAHGDLAPAELAHELNSTIDGSMRHLRLALDNAQSFGDESANHVRSALSGLERIAAMLERIMHSSELSLGVFEQSATLQEVVERSITSLSALASTHRVELRVEMTPKARAIAATCLEPIIQNGLRNAIEACAHANGRSHVVELSIAVNQQSQLLMIIVDDGTGLSGLHQSRAAKQCHGIGLALCERIVNELGGESRLTNVPFGQGAILQVTIPLRSLPDNE